MIDVRKLRWMLFGASLLILGLAIGLLFINEQMTCMGVRVISQEKAAEFTEYEYEDFSEHLFYNGEKAALDVKNSTIYVCQTIEQNTKQWQLEGKLTIDFDDYQLFFLEDEGFQDMKTAVAQGHTFPLIVTNGGETYMQYQVVFTTLPVLRLDGLYSHTDEEDREVLEGRICVWDPLDSDMGRYSVKTSDLQWRMRGGSTLTFQKNSWKLSAKTETGENRNISLLGLGADDDWILNSMCVDDTKLREKLVMELWNELASQTDYNYNMSRGKYVEVIINREYCGLYLLQRRVDAKYLELGEEDVILKGKPVWQAATVSDAYEIVYSPLSQGETYALMEGVWSNTDASIMDRNNFIDVSLLVQMGVMTDNTGYKNMFYVLQKQEEGYRLKLVPWDTDLAFGTTWLENFICDEALNMTTSLDRVEYDAVKKQHPELDSAMASRWRELRQGLLSLEHMLSVLSAAEETLSNSGALIREQNRWEQVYGGKDTIEALCRYLEGRLLWMDDRFGAV